MKKYAKGIALGVCLVLILGMCIGLCGCGESGEDPEAADDTKNVNETQSDLVSYPKDGEALNCQVPYLEEAARLLCYQAAAGVKTEGCPLSEKEAETVTELLETIDLAAMEEVEEFETNDSAPAQNGGIVMGGLQAFYVDYGADRYMISLQQSDTDGNAAEYLEIRKNGEQERCYQGQVGSLPLAELMQKAGEIIESREDKDVVFYMTLLTGKDQKGQYVKKGDTIAIQTLLENELAANGSSEKNKSASYTIQFQNGEDIYQVDVSSGAFLRESKKEKRYGTLGENELYLLQRILRFY